MNLKNEKNHRDPTIDKNIISLSYLLSHNYG